MDHYDVKRFALILAVQAEIEGMKACNTDSDMKGFALAYDETSFNEKAEQLRNLAASHNEQL